MNNFSDGFVTMSPMVITASTWTKLQRLPQHDAISINCWALDCTFKCSFCQLELWNPPEPPTPHLAFVAPMFDGDARGLWKSVRLMTVKRPVYHACGAAEREHRRAAGFVLGLFAHYSMWIKTYQESDIAHQAVSLVWFLPENLWIPCELCPSVTRCWLEISWVCVTC